MLSETNQKRPKIKLKKKNKLKVINIRLRARKLNKKSEQTYLCQAKR